MLLEGGKGEREDKLGGSVWGGGKVREGKVCCGEGGRHDGMSG